MRVWHQHIACRRRFNGRLKTAGSSKLVLMVLLSVFAGAIVYFADLGP